MAANIDVVKLTNATKSVAMDCFYIASQSVGDAYALPDLIMHDVNVGGEPVFIAQENGYVRGFVRGRVSPCGQIVRIHDLYVDLRARKRGIGRKLLNAYEAYARGCGVKSLHVQARSGAVNFYARHGFIRVGAGNMFQKTL